ncbi:deazapurine DNA modification protein DpdA family protein [Nonomuraea sediminis]|uniref:deazapurine DNA modification protein DpdA family protein n=1 Tax=Nonomuraea sediminis TaxID=2835864 RepID=UPI001BDD04E2|nr:hypothetical protein [Nonomuraea sediminis]
MIYEEEELNFYLGTHRERWLITAPLDVSLFISHRVLARRATLPRAPLGRHYAIDSGAFTELSLYGGEFRTSPEEYVRALARYDDEIGDIAWAAPQDWMCEPFILAKTGLTVAEHQRRTVENFVTLTALWEEQGAPGDCPVMPVIQGWQLDDYLRCVELYEQHGVRLAKDYPVVGVGSVCRRQGTAEIGEIFRTLARLDLPLHGFGVKIAGLRQYGRWLTSADSMAWSFQGRRTPTACGSSTHKNEANCQSFALTWLQRVWKAAARPQWDQRDLFEVPEPVETELYGAAAGSGTMGLVSLVTLGEWAAKVGRAETAVRNHLTDAPGFPAPKGTRPREGSGTPYEEYEESELDAWLKAWETKHAPARYEVPGDPGEYRTLGAIAKLLGVDGKTVTQYRALLDQHAAHEDRGARRFYRTGDVVEVLNSRKGFGVALDPARDRRRTAAADDGPGAPSA